MEKDREMENAMSTPPTGPQHLSLSRLYCQFTKREACAGSYLVLLWWAARTLGYWDDEASMHHLPDGTQTSSFTKVPGQPLIWAAISCRVAQACTVTWCQTRASRAALFLSLTACCNLRDGGFSMLRQPPCIIMQARSSLAPISLLVPASGHLPGVARARFHAGISPSSSAQLSTSHRGYQQKWLRPGENL